MPRLLNASVLTFSLLAAAASSAAAQSANINVTANVYQALTVSGARDLAFGNVFPGVNKTVALADGTSGRFDITGQSGATVSLNFSLPNSGNYITGPSSAQLALNSWTACWSTSNSASGCTSFSASGGTSGGAFGSGSTLFVFLGATAAPTAAQAAGSYSGQVTLTVAYVN